MTSISHAKISIFGITQLQRHDPLMVAWFSALFPGFGHYLLNRYFRATLLTLFEFTINTLAHINEAMVYSFTGQFELATSVLEPRWAFGYLIIYLITIWDSYRSAISQNKMAELAEFENNPIHRVEILASDIQHLERKKPMVAAFYSFFFPGLGQIYNHRFCLGFYAMLWWWFYLTITGLHESLLYLMLGDFQASHALLHPQWLLFMPSVMGGATVEAYVTAIEHNKLYRLSQRQHLCNRYGNTKLKIINQEGVMK
ncbi:hypothetical protein [Evansella cellulosilytica]|uniref:Uncharacterized protein n=1 Tax=Evansella cellulosilytica (strain ATCC 21833 / DSM 2522 / FERM P-1141 / JCM 9156 / N-4) TaxID=649639 RepID=E6TXJ5_EVAC2|nr:hypothetical protein [Evansella cellulosilytica]ADU28809.1 hypothetical protein Bcell_0527 [Evansella cellulosilytica DSM 2522]